MRKEGKVVKVLKLRSNGQGFDIPLRLREKRHGTDFEYSVDCDNPPIRVSHAEVNECVRLAKEALDVVTAIKWTPILMLEIDTEQDIFGREDRRDYGKLILQARLMEKGESGGRPVWRTQGESRIQDYSPDGTEIPDTPQNRVKVDSILAGLRTLGARVQELLSQKNILVTLQKSMALLPAPEKSERKTRTKAKRPS